MATTIVDDLQWFGFGNQKLSEQQIPSHEELVAFGAEETGYTIRDYESSRKDADLAEGRNDRTYSINSPQQRTDVIFVPDTHGWYVENHGGQKWRPENLDQLRDLLEEMDFQINRYGDLL